MADTIAQLAISVDSSSANQANTALQGLGNTAGWLEGIVTKLVAAFALLKLGEFAKDSIMLAARYETLGVAMDVVGRNAGYSSQQMAGFQAGLEKTGISMIESRNNLARMAAAQLDLNQASALGRVAQDAAVIAGINSSEAFERMVQGIVSGQPRILHTMGIFADFGRVEKEWADANDRAKDSLTTVEKVQIRMNEVLLEGKLRTGAYEASMDTAGKQIKSMERYIEDLQVKLGGLFGPALQQIVFEFVNNLKGMSSSLDEMQKSGQLVSVMADLKANVGGVAHELMVLTQGLWAHRDAVLLVMGAYASFKGAQFISFLVDSAVSLKTAALASTVAAQTQAQANFQLATSAAVTATAEYEAAVAEDIRTFSIGVETKALDALDVAQARHVAAIEAVIVAEGELAAAGTASATASGVAGTAIAALGGPITILITLLGAAVAAWYLFKDSTREDASSATKSIEEQTAALDKKIQKQKDYWDLIAHGATAEQAAKGMRGTAEESPYYMNELAKLEALQKKLDESFKGVRQGATATIGQQEMQTELDRGYDALLAYKTKFEEAQAGADLVEADQLKRAKAGRPGSPAGEDPLGKDRDSMLQSLREEIITLSQGKAALEAYKVAQVGLTDSLENRLAIQLRLHAADRQIVADEMAAIGQYNAGIRGKREDDSLSIKTAYQQAIDPMTKYRDRLAEINRLPFLTNAEKLYAERKAWEDLTEAGKNLVALRREAKQIEEQTRTPAEKALKDLERLDAMLKGGLLTQTAYDREWIKIQQDAQTAAGYAADAWTVAVDGMSNAFANFITTGKGSFKSLVSSILADLAKLEANKAFSSLLGMGLSALASYFGGGVTYAGGNGNYGLDTLPTGGTTGTGYTPPAGIAAPKGGAAGASVSSQVYVTVQQNGNTTSDSKGQGQNAAELGRMIGAKVREVIVTEMRPAGLLNPVGS